MRYALRRAVVIVAVSTLTGCAGNSPEPIDVAGPASPIRLSAGEFRQAPDAPVSPRRDVAIAVSGQHAILFGGIAKTHGETTLAPDGALYNARSRDWMTVPRWPWAAPYRPGIVGTTRGFVVVGTPCDVKNVGGDEEALNCGDRVHAALFDPHTAKWTELAPPELGESDRGTRPVFVDSLGASTSTAYFRFLTSQVELIGGYDIDRDQWSIIEMPDGYTPSDAESDDSNSVCFTYGTVVAARTRLAQEVLETWTLDDGNDWNENPSDSVVPGRGARAFDCAGTELLFLVGVDEASDSGSSWLAQLRAYDPEARRWQDLPTPNVQSFDTDMPAIQVGTTWLLWPTAEAAPSLFKAPANSEEWLTPPRPAFAGTVQLLHLDEAVLVVPTPSSYEIPTLGMYGV